MLSDFFCSICTVGSFVRCMKKYTIGYNIINQSINRKNRKRQGCENNISNLSMTCTHLIVLNQKDNQNLLW